MSQATDYAISDQEVAREIIRQVVPHLDFNKQELQKIGSDVEVDWVDIIQVI